MSFRTPSKAPAIGRNTSPALIADDLNRLRTGKMNVTTTITLETSASTTSFVNARIGPSSFLGFMPQTSNAAAALTGLYVTSQINGSATLNHASNGQTDRSYIVLIIG